ncbi:SANT/Myb_domain [Hexamita inflata]|uniref:SANT/Myb_domain n=1 Tax=Hexamita inflata TaxID=28002 RepID=A0ABP1GGM5_9EUKA
MVGVVIQEVIVFGLNLCLNANKSCCNQLFQSLPACLEFFTFRYPKQFRPICASFPLSSIQIYSEIEFVQIHIFVLFRYSAVYTVSRDHGNSFHIRMPRQIFRWSKEEHALFTQLVKEHGLEFKKIASLIPNRSYNQVRSHFYNHVNDSADSFQEEAPVQNQTAVLTPPNLSKAEAPELTDFMSFFIDFEVFE